MLADAGYMQITPVYNGSSHIEYGIYFWTAKPEAAHLEPVLSLWKCPQSTHAVLVF